MKKLSSLGLGLSLTLLLNVHSAPQDLLIPILSDPYLLKVAKITPLEIKSELGIAYAEVRNEDLARLQRVAHEHHRCGGFERLTSRNDYEQKSKIILAQHLKAQKFLKNPQKLSIPKQEFIEKAVGLVQESGLQEFVTWFSSFPTRFNRNSNANAPVNALKDRITTLINSKPKESWVRNLASVTLVSHQSTPQNSVRLHIEGTKNPQDIVVLGSHLDSISWNGQAPGADDNASGSSNVYQIAQIVLSQEKAPERSIDFFWYAGEESGLLGSAEIARTYKNQSKTVVGVMQLDMTLFPGTGVGTMGSMTDFTHPWLRSVMNELNSLYVNAKIVDDKCGYGCSDHASWHSNGYPAVMPFEAGFGTMNDNIHTAQDRIDGQSSFVHSAYFSRLGVAFALELANSDLRAP